MNEPTSSPRPSRIARLTATGLLGLAAVATLAGCANPMDIVSKVHTETFSDRKAADEGWVGVRMPEWIPADAGPIHSTATMNETNAVIFVEGGSDPQGCEEQDRRSLPFDGRYGGFPEDDALPATVLACGPYEVLEIESGLLGWFNATEEGQTPDDL
ncbi:hypothetical protein [Microbacterium sp. zg.Y1084]|uniref:hypothetical protein n=1 Tax=Microbacterium sp. zg.Y1084 TaxID=2969667 RepID=UPI00214C9A2D|nr:hypothetical protein [Microbacterium sp. zg.Y1084]MCR2812584.1 hypothetical protein [Microbacterium sp. zg.Y1084]